MHPATGPGEPGSLIRSHNRSRGTRVPELRPRERFWGLKVLGKDSKSSEHAPSDQLRGSRNPAWDPRELNSRCVSKEPVGTVKALRNNSGSKAACPTAFALIAKVHAVADKQLLERKKPGLTVRCAPWDGAFCFGHKSPNPEVPAFRGHLYGGTLGGAATHPRELGMVLRSQTLFQGVWTSVPMLPLALIAFDLHNKRRRNRKTKLSRSTLLRAICAAGRFCSVWS